MNTKTAVVWDIDATNEEVVKESVRESTAWNPSLSLLGEPEAAFKPDLRKKVEKHHYATGGKYRGKSWTAHIELVMYG